MRAFLGTATAVAVLGLSGCAHESPAPQAPSSAPTPAPAGGQPTDPGPLPTPSALTDVITRLADPAVAGADKRGLVENAGPADAAALDTFAAALRDNGFTPVTVSATDIRWSPTRPGEAQATITVTGPASASAPSSRPGGREFSFVMTFRRSGDGWQLSRETTDLLLAAGN